MTRYTYNSSDVFIAHTKSRAVRVEAYGAGGGGGGFFFGVPDTGGGDGGGGGAYATGAITVRPGQRLPVHVGAGGLRGALGTPGGDGGPSWVGQVPLVLAQGGQGGKTRLSADTRHLAQGGQAQGSKGATVRAGGGSGPGWFGGIKAGGGGGGSSASRYVQGESGGAAGPSFGGYGGVVGIDGGSGGDGAAPPGQPPQQYAQPGFPPGGGGGGAGARRALQFALSSFDVLIIATGGGVPSQFFDVATGIDWHSLVSYDDISQLASVNLVVAVDGTDAGPNGGPNIEIELGFGRYGSLLGAVGVVGTFLTVHVFGRFYGSDAYGTEAEPVLWTGTVIWAE